ncbi:DUF3108 domain-containing protein [Candidatus Magnetaquicoccus inordinatus]|uniref:DUF3108 domain-containing protein n=1 Tax=Candidatus Magnetaquicoccus inordinatus TaxID=2496818 RepID=UPI00102C3CFD|nr:DUF3108 domain-containing protein [Candidatus Magnetaquicoccus inordinatus]
MKQLLVVLSILCLWGVSALAATERTWRLGAADGEHLDYRLRWLGVTAADATLQLQRKNGSDYAAKATLSTIAGARLLKTIDETLTADGQERDGHFAAHHFVKDQLRGDQRKWTSFLFDREMHQVFRRHRPQEDKAEERLIIPVESALVTDPLSALYALRAWPELMSGQRLQRTIVDGEKSFCLNISIGGSQQWQSAIGSFRAFSIQIAVENSELFRQRGPIQMLVTDDARRIPLQIEAQLSIGAVVAELVGFSDGRGESRRSAE